MASVTFVGPNIRVVCRGTTTFTPTKQLVDKSTGSDASLSREENLKLVAWKISGKAWLLKIFQRELQNLLQMPGSQDLRLITNVSGTNILAGI